MHDDEVPIDATMVRQLLRQQYPRWADLALRRVRSAGTDNALFRLGSELVVRLPRIHWAVDAVEREQRWLPRLAPHLPVRIPVPMAMGEPGFGYPWRWSVYRWLDGENPTTDALDDPVRLATELGAFVRALRDIDATGAPAALRGVPLQERDGQTRHAIAALGEGVEARSLIRAWDAALRVPLWQRSAVWLHGDLAPGNLLIRGAGLHAVIDFGAAGAGDPACDLVAAWNLLPRRARQAFKHAADVDDHTWQRGRGWALSIALVQLPYYVTRNPPLAANARRVIAEVLDDSATYA